MPTAKDPADAVREALERIRWDVIGPHGDPRDIAALDTIESRLAALAGAGPVYSGDLPGHKTMPGFITPERTAALHAAIGHAPAKAREVTDEMVERGAEAFWNLGRRGVSWPEATHYHDEFRKISRAISTAALATFAEGESK